MNRLRLQDRTFQIIFLSLIFLGIALGIYVGINGLSKELIVLALGVPFLVITVNRPWVALSLFFFLLPMEELFLRGGSNAPSTLNKLIGVYLVFLAVTSGSLKYISEVFKNKKVLCILLFGIVSLISISYSKDLTYVVKWLTKLWLLIILYFVLVMMIRDIKTLNYAFYAIILGAVISVLSPLVFGHGDIVRLHNLVRYGGLSGDQNEFAALLLAVISICIAVIFTAKKQIIKISSIVCCAILFVGFIFTYSRSGYIAFSVILLLSMFKLIIGKNRGKILAIAVPCVIIAFIAIYLTVADRILSRVESLRIVKSEQSVRSESSLHKRYQYYFKIGPEIFKAHPLFGVGFRGFIFYNPYKEISHNMFLEVVTGTGIVGLIPFVLIIFLTWRDLKRVQNISNSDGDGTYLLYYSNALELGFIANVVVGQFYTLDINKTVWLLIALSSVLVNLAAIREINPSVRTTDIPSRSGSRGSPFLITDK